MGANPARIAVAARYCPYCLHRPLEACSYAACAVDVCPRCAGLWCEPASWDPKVLGAFPAVGVASEVTPGGPMLEAQPRPDRACPNCRRPLTAIRVGGSEGCELDQCDRCGGVWFDHGEWDHLEYLQTFQAHEKNLQRPTTWGEWAFQFILKLPIEFNVPARRPPMVTLVMIALCVVVYLVQLAVPQDRWLHYATTASRVWRGEGLYALLTSSFLHASLLHLLGNMYFLYILGDNVEDALGKWRYTLLYLGSAVASDLLHVVIFRASDVPLMGASGAVFGVMAAYLLLYPKARLTMLFFFWQFKVTFVVWMGLYLLVQVVGAVLTWPGQSSGVAYWGHLGGFLAGLLFVWPQRRRLIQGNPLLRLLHQYRAPAKGAGATVSSTA